MTRRTTQRPGLGRRELVVAGAAGGFALLVHALALAAPAKGDAVDLPRLSLLDGSALDPADWLGRRGVIVFWSTDCPFCQRHNARLEQLYQRARARGSDLRIVALATDGDADLVRRHVAARGWHFPVGLATPAIRAAFTDRRVVPITVLIDRQGRLQLAIPGEMSADDVLAIDQPAG